MEAPGLPSGSLRFLTAPSCFKTSTLNHALFREFADVERFRARCRSCDPRQCRRFAAIGPCSGGDFLSDRAVGAGMAYTGPRAAGAGRWLLHRRRAFLEHGRASLPQRFRRQAAWLLRPAGVGPTALRRQPSDAQWPDGRLRRCRCDRAVAHRPAAGRAVRGRLRSFRLSPAFADAGRHPVYPRSPRRRRPRSRWRYCLSP